MIGIDVAKWQGDIDWKRVKKGGVKFAILKAIDKKNKSESAFEKNYKGATENNIPVGVYTYTYANTIEKAKVSAKALAKTIEGKDLPMGVWLDIEDVCMKNLGESLIDIIEVYKKEVESLGFDFGVYTYISFFNDYIKKYDNKKYDYWIARYPSTKEMFVTSEPNMTKKPNIGTRTMKGWQFSSNGKVLGIKGNVDLNIWFESKSSQDVPSLKGYKGFSIVDGLKAFGYPSSFDYRGVLWAKIGKTSKYKGTAKQNTELLNYMKAH